MTSDWWKKLIPKMCPSIFHAVTVTSSLYMGGGGFQLLELKIETFIASL